MKKRTQRTREEITALVDQIETITRTEDITAKEACARLGVRPVLYYNWKKILKAAAAKGRGRPKGSKTNHAAKRKPEVLHLSAASPFPLPSADREVGWQAGGPRVVIVSCPIASIRQVLEQMS